MTTDHLYHLRLQIQLRQAMRELQRLRRSKPETRTQSSSEIKKWARGAVRLATHELRNAKMLANSNIAPQLPALEYTHRMVENELYELREYIRHTTMYNHMQSPITLHMMRHEVPYKRWLVRWRDKLSQIIVQQS